jgi:hypothetical protein
MSWDAAATRDGELLAISPDYWSIEDLPLRRAFESAARRLQTLCGGAPAYFENGQLSGGGQKEMFEQALRLHFYEISDGQLQWSAEDVRRMNDIADWSFDCDPALRIDYWTARVFLQTCAERGLGIFMSW